jgi:hypothetical protein
MQTIAWIPTDKATRNAQDPHVHMYASCYDYEQSASVRTSQAEFKGSHHPRISRQHSASLAVGGGRSERIPRTSPHPLATQRCALAHNHQRTCYHWPQSLNNQVSSTNQPRSSTALVLSLPPLGTLREAAHSSPTMNRVLRISRDALVVRPCACACICANILWISTPCKSGI